MNTAVLAGPVIPDFGGSRCEAAFCFSWVQDNWDAVLLPALIQHIYITAIAVVAGLVISLIAAAIAFRYRWFERGWVALSTLIYTFPAVAFFLLFISITGLNLFTVELALTGYTFLLLFRNALTGLRSVPPAAVAAAVGMGMTPRQVFFRVNVPLAVPSIMAGVRVAAVTVISLATLAAFLTPYGLGAPIFQALQTVFQTQLVAAGVLAILFALAADLLLVLLQKLITPWARTRTATAKVR